MFSTHWGRDEIAPIRRRHFQMHFIEGKCMNFWSLILKFQLTHWGRDIIGHLFPDDIIKWIFLIENVWISIELSLKLVPKGSINNIPALVQIMAWRRPGDKPLPEPMMVSLLTHICVTRPQWVNTIPALAQIMFCRPGDKPLSVPMMVD